MNKIRKKLDEMVKTEGNKLIPHAITGKLSGTEYGLGDLLTYPLGYRHLGAVVGASIPVLRLMHGFEYNIPNVIVNTIIGIPFELAFGGLGYIAGSVGDVVNGLNKKIL